MFDVLSRADLLQGGWTPRRITAAIRAGDLVRARRDRYVTAAAPAPLLAAVRIGGRLGCTSLLAQLGVFVFDSSVLHVHMERGDSRLRSPHSRHAPLPSRRRRERVVLHWHRFIAPTTSGTVSVIDALVHAVRCQSIPHAVATLDSALHARIVGWDDIDDVLDHLPQRFRILRSFLDPRAESGTETIVRLMVRHLGCHVDLQVKFRGVGFVDLVVDGWLVIECDSKKFHSSWEQQLKDFRRDLVLAKQGYGVLRLAAEDILYAPDDVFESVRGLVLRRRG